MATRRPSIPVVQTTARDLKSFTDAVKENIELMLGVRGDPLDRVVTLRDLQAMGLDVTGALMARGIQPGKSVQQAAVSTSSAATGLSSYLTDAEAFARQIFATRLFQDLAAGFDDPARFAWVPDQLRQELASSIAEEAAKRGADIRSIDKIVQSATESFASRLEEITAGMSGAAAGVRELSFAYANADRAIAADVTQVQAQLDGVDVTADTLGVGGTTGGAAYATLAALKAAVATGVTSPTRKYYKVANPVSGQPNLLYTWDLDNATPQYKLAGKGTTTGVFMAGVEQTLKASADRSTGAEAQYTIKVTAGGAWAGIGLAATDNGSGNASSAIIIQADRFAIVTSGYAGGQTLSPSAASVPFGIDGTGIYMNTSVRVDGSLLVNGTVTATQLSATAIDAMTVTGATIRTASGTGRRVVMNSSGITAYNTSNAVTFDLDATGNAQFNSAYFATGSTNAIVATGSGSTGVIYGANSGSGYGVYGSSSSGSGVVGIAGASGVAGSFSINTFATNTYLAANVSGVTYGLYTDGRIKSTLATGTAPLQVTSTTYCQNLRANFLGNGTNNYEFSGGSQTGAQTIGFSNTNKPGSSTANNGWLKITIDATSYWIPIWPD